MQHFTYACSVFFCVQTNGIRQPLNNHTRPFISKVQNTASTLSGGHDPGARVDCTDHACCPGYAAKDSASKHLPKSQGMLVFR